MKAVTLALLLANLLLFGWLYSHPREEIPNGALHTNGLPASVEPLVLLRERTKTPAPESAADPRVAELNQASSAAVAMNPAVEPEAVAVTVPPEATDASTPAQATDTAASEAVATDSAAIETATTAATPTVPPVDVAAVTVPERVCQIIGPFPERSQADAFVARLAALGREPAIRTAQIEQPSGFWVYLPSMPRAEAQRIVDELSAKGVKDYFLGRQNFISLGVFSDKRSAETRIREITALGYAPRLEPRFLTREVLWVDLEESTAQRIDDAQWAALLADQADIRRQAVACE